MKDSNKDKPKLVSISSVKKETDEIPSKQVFRATYLDGSVEDFEADVFDLEMLPIVLLLKRRPDDSFDLVGLLPTNNVKHIKMLKEVDTDRMCKQ